MREAVEVIEQGIAGLRTIIADLRPAALDEIGLKPAIEALLERRREGQLQIDAHLELPDSRASAGILDPELETTVYRIVQEALTNIVKHARARVVHVMVIASAEEIVLEIRDDGVGFDVDASTEGFGLAGMRERVYLAGGSLEITSGEDGTVLRVVLPNGYASGAARDRTRGLV